MADKVWRDMHTTEKLDWLFARVQELQGHLRDTATASSATRAIANVDAKIQKVAKDLEELKKHVEVTEEEE